MCKDIYYSLDLIANANQFWSTIEGVSPAHCKSIIHVDTVSDSNNLNNLTVPWPTEPEYCDS